jgi:anti-sigma B factor antagonist
MRDMQVDEVGQDGAVLHPVGRLDLQSATAFRERVAGVVGTGRARVVVDLAGVAFLDSSGLGALIASLKTCRQAGGDLRIAAVTDQVATVLELTQMHRVLRTYAGVDEALDGM